MPRHPRSNSCLSVFVSLAILLVVDLLVMYCYLLNRDRQLACNRIETSLMKLKYLRPPIYTKPQWDYLIGWSKTGHGNCIASNFNIPTKSIDNIALELERKISENIVDIKIFEWFWHELSLLDSLCFEYVKKYNPTVDYRNIEVEQFGLGVK